MQKCVNEGPTVTLGGDIDAQVGVKSSESHKAPTVVLGGSIDTQAGARSNINYGEELVSDKASDAAEMPIVE